MIHIIRFSLYFFLGCFLAHIGYSCFTYQYWVIMLNLLCIQLIGHAENEH